MVEAHPLEVSPGAGREPRHDPSGAHNRAAASHGAAGSIAGSAPGLIAAVRGCHRYLPRRPEQTVLYQLVRDNLEPFLEHAREHYDKGLPRYVEQELRGYLRCGDFDRGFVRC
ncbi:MAG: hypothetical protein HY744_30860, partial [Deltaproteobacteria bacterium]|nr:hypothetical protein [Deltaproteobacteria bacterium]